MFFGLIVFGTLCFLHLNVCFLTLVKEISSYDISTYVLCTPLSSPSEIFIIKNVGAFDAVTGSFQFSSFIYLFFMFSFNVFYYIVF